MPLRTKVTNVTFDDIEAGAPSSLTRTLTRTVIEVLALVTRDVSPLHIESYSDEARRDTNEIQAVGGEAFVSSVPGTQLPGPGMKIIEQDFAFYETNAVEDKLAAKNLVNGKDYYCHLALKIITMNPQKLRDCVLK